MVFSSLRSEEVEEEVQLLGAPEEELANSPDGSQHCLWVDEFAPQYYTELLSDDVRPCRSNDWLFCFQRRTVWNSANHCVVSSQGFGVGGDGFD